MFYLKKSTEKCRIQLKEHIRLALKTVLCLLFVHYLSFCLFSSDLKTLRVFFCHFTPIQSNTHCREKSSTSLHSLSQVLPQDDTPWLQLIHEFTRELKREGQTVAGNQIPWPYNMMVELLICEEFAWLANINAFLVK